MLAIVYKFLLNVLKSIIFTIARALLNTLNGFLISAAMCWISFGLLLAPAIMLHVALDFSGVSHFGFSIALRIVLFTLTLLTISAMLLGRFIWNPKPKEFDSFFTNQAFDILFMGYGSFITLLIVQIYVYHKFNEPLFSQSNVGLIEIIIYCVELTLLGFIPDVLQYRAIEPSLTPQGSMLIIQFMVKLLMAITVVSGTLRYLEARYEVILFPF